LGDDVTEAFLAAAGLLITAGGVMTTVAVNAVR
jgi:hypothetical protein